MFRKNFLLTLVLTFVAFSISAFAQDTSIVGKVMLKKDGAPDTPHAGVTVSCYLLKDFVEGGNTACGTATSGDDGKFSISGLDAETKYVLSAFGPGVGPRVTLPVKPSAKEIEIITLAGDGASLTKIEVWQAFAFSDGGGGFTSDQKAAQAVYEKELAAKTANNEKIQEKNKRVQEALDAGNKAYNSGDYDTAVAKYEEGYQVDPEFVGSAPILLNNKGLAIKKRAVDIFNVEVKSSDAAVKSAAKPKATKDLAVALEAFEKAYGILKKAGSAEMAKENSKKNALNALDGARDVIRIMALLEVADPALVGQAKSMTYALLELETDKMKKSAAQTNFGKFLMYAGDYDNAATELKKALELSSNDPEVLANLGLSLYTAGAINESKQQKQESLNYFSVYLKVAPKDHKLRGDIEAMVSDLTTTDKLKPQKIN